MNSRKVDRLLNVHTVVHHVSDDAKGGIDNCRATGTADGEPQAAVLTQNEGWCHRGERALAWRYRVALALDQPVHVRRSWLRREIIHFVVKKYSGAFGHCG